MLVDEVQDLSPVQLRLIRALLPEDGSGFFGIGDPDQAIYGFRGASGQSEDSLRAIWPSLRVCRLGQSYRASQGVLDMAQSLLQGRGHCGALQAMRGEQARLHLFSAPDQQAEARWIAGRIRRLLGATAHTLMDQIAQEDELAGTLSPGDVAVLVRLKAQIPVIRRALEQEGIPCAAPAQEDCWQDPLCAAVLRLAIARDQGEAPAPAGDGAEDDDLLPILEQALDLAPDAPLPDPRALQARLSGHSRLPAPLWQGTAWKQLCRAWQDCGRWEALVQQLGLQHEAELIRARSEQVQILTLHASKGLEFQAVFLPGLEEGLLPMRRELLLENPDDDMSPAAQAARLEEERRLFYVAITRAEDHCFLTYAKSRYRYGKMEFGNPSRFLKDIDVRFLKLPQDAGLSRRIDENAMSFRRENKENISSGMYGKREERVRPRQEIIVPTVPRNLKRVTPSMGTASAASHSLAVAGGNTVQPGQLIEHERFGLGEVMKVEGEGDNAKATIRFKNAGDKQLLLRFARFKVIG